MRGRRVTLGLGANLGDRAATLRAAIESLEAREILELEAVSPIVVSEALVLDSVVDGTATGGSTTHRECPPYLNQVVQGRCVLTPDELLVAIGQIERELGRDRSTEERWGSRCIDIDILDYDGDVIRSSSLTVPHPRIVERTFVLMPWAHIAPGQRLPGHEKTIAELLEQPGRTGWTHWWRADSAGDPHASEVNP